MRETFRRRRAAGGPAEQTFAALVGLELRPRRLRDAALLWALLGQARGSEGRDALWAHPNLLPSAADLDDPEAFVHRREADLEVLGRLLEDDEPAGSDEDTSADQDTSESGQGPDDEE
jgi:hypothetical protein